MVAAFSVIRSNRGLRAPLSVPKNDDAARGHGMGIFDPLALRRHGHGMGIFVSHCAITDN